MIDARPARVSDKILADLRERIARTRQVANPWGSDAGRGLTARDLRALLERWATGYDWREHEARIRDQPWALTGPVGRQIRSIHRRSQDPDATAVVLLHGWPDSVLRFERLLPLLGDCHVVVPALPGYPFAAPLADMPTADRIADMVAESLDELGYRRYVVSGGDVGGIVAELLTARLPDRVLALHLTNVAAGHVATADPATLPADARAYLDEVGQWRRTEAGFIAEQSTRPSTVIAALGDSPVGLLAWIGEKLVGWSDTTAGSAALTADELLTWVSAYWLTGAIGTSFSTYVEPSRLPDRVDVPTVISAFARDIIPAPRSFDEAFVDVRQFVEHEAGGHFAAWEQPELYAADLRRAVALSAHAQRH